MTISRFTTARDRILAVTDAGVDSAAVLRAALAALHDVTTFSWAAMMGVDPDTILPVSAVIEGFDESACVPFWEAELTLPGYLKFTDLARSHDPVGTLWEATDGDLMRSPVYATIYAPLGAADELRAVFTLGSSAWGVVSLVRGGADGPFDAVEVGEVRQLARFIARALRSAIVRSESLRSSSTACVLFDRDYHITPATMEGRALLDSLRAVEWVSAPDALGPGVLRALITQARFNLAGRHVESRVRDIDGRWFRVRAARTDAADGTVAVVIEPASSADLFSMTMASFGLTDRECDIVRYLARGLSSIDIAAELSLSPHTVRDHVKAILRKCGASSRGELVAQLFADRLKPALHRSTVESV